MEHAIYMDNEHMKIKFITSTLILLALPFLSVDLVYATEGSCSWHGGVNCNAGPDLDGSEICKDGWRDSTVNFANSVECTNQISCTDAEFNALYDKYQIRERINEINAIKSQIDSIYTELMTAIADVEGKSMTMQRIAGAKQRLIDDANSQINPLKAQLDLLTSSLNFDTAQADAECKALGQDRLRKMQLDALTRAQTFLEQQRAQAVILPQIQCPINSSPKNDGICYCNAGYTALNNGCADSNVACRSKHGEGSIAVDGECECKEGFHWVADKAICEVDMANTKIDKYPQPKYETRKSKESVETSTAALVVTPTSESTTSTIVPVSSTEFHETIVQGEVQKQSIINKVTSVIKIFFTNLFKKLKFWQR